MEKTATLRRKAHRLVQEGELEKAVLEYEKVLEAGEADPYDFVFLGDLHLRRSETARAIGRYDEAVLQYERTGLTKNAIALVKKILRLQKDRLPAYRKLGDLYCQENLPSEAAAHYFTYLSHPGGDGVPEGALDCLRNILTSVPRQHGVIEKIAEFIRKFDLAADGAPLLLRLSDELERRHALETSSWVRSLALEMDPEVLARAAEAPPEPSPAPGASGARAGGGGGFALSAIDEVLGARAASPEPPAPQPGTRAAGSAAPSRGLPAGASGSPAPARSAGTLPWQEVLGKADFLLLQDKAEWAIDEYLLAAHEAILAGDALPAGAIYEKVIQLSPDHPEALRGLLLVAEHGSDAREIVSAALRLGEVLLASERYAEALGVYERVLESDPRNERAKMRIGRLRTMVAPGTEIRPESPAAGGREVRVTVRADEVERPSAFDLGSILSEFKSGIAGSIPEEDGQSHYDLGMSYMEMDLYPEAIEEFRIASRDEDRKLRAFEMLGHCHLKSGNPEEAVKILTWASSLADARPDESARLAYALGLAFEECGQIGDALSHYERAMELDPAMAGAAERAQALRAGKDGVPR